MGLERSISEQVEDVLDALVAISPGWEITYWNRGAESVFGRTAAESIGRSYLDLVVPPGEVDGVQAWVQSALATAAVAPPRQYVCRRKDGALIYAYTSIKVVRREAGDVDFIALSKRDVTDLTCHHQAQVLAARYRGLLDAVPDATLMVNGVGRIVLANRQAERMFGYDGQELMGRPVELLVPDRLRRAHGQYRDAYYIDPQARPMGAGLELHGRRKDGGELAVEISLTPVATEGQHFVTATVRDVTERRKAEARFRGLLESAPDAMVIVDGSGQVALVNSQAEALLGWGRDELVGQPVEVLLPERFRLAHLSHRSHYHRQPVTRPMGAALNLWARRKDGTQIPVEISLSPLETSEGQLVTAAIRDISERRRMEAQLKEALSQAQQRSAEWEVLFESLADPVLVLEQPDRVVTANAAGLRLLGLTTVAELPPDLPGLQRLVTFTDQDGGPLPTDQWPMCRVLRDEAVDEVPCRLCRDSGPAVELLVSGAATPPVGGLPRRYVCVHRDVTQFRRLEQAREEFLHVVTHELLNPVATAQLFVGLSRQQLGVEQQRTDEQLDIVAGQLQRFEQVLGEIVTGYRVASGRLGLNVAAVDLAEVVAAAVRPYRLGGSPHEWRVELARGRLPVQADPERLGDVLSNLCRNAAKYTPPGRRIAITAMAQGSEAILHIDDEGVGIPTDQLEQVFEPFYRIRPADGADPGGLGLGLYISRDIVRRHGGELWAENRPGGGTRMSLRLPLQKG